MYITTENVSDKTAEENQTHIFHKFDGTNFVVTFPDLQEMNRQQVL